MTMSKIVTFALSLCILVICLHSSEGSKLKVYKRQASYGDEGDYTDNDYANNDPDTTVKRQIQPDTPINDKTVDSIENSVNDVDSEFSNDYWNDRNDNVDWVTDPTKKPLYDVNDKDKTDYEPTPWYNHVANFAKHYWGKAVDKVKSWGKRASLV